MADTLTIWPVRTPADNDADKTEHNSSNTFQQPAASVRQLQFQGFRLYIFNAITPIQSFSLPSWFAQLENEYSTFREPSYLL